MPPMPSIKRGPIRSTRYPSNGTSQVSTRMKRLKIPWIAVRVTCRWACIGLVKRVQAYCRFAIAIMAIMPAIN